MIVYTNKTTTAMCITYNALFFTQRRVYERVQHPGLGLLRGGAGDRAGQDGGEGQTSRTVLWLPQVKIYNSEQN